MKIAKIVKSNSHVDYVARVLDGLESAVPPEVEDYHFARFVFIPSEHSTTYGLIYNSQLVNPEFGRLGPRLSGSLNMNAVFSPDLLNEQGVLIGILLIGWVDENGEIKQGIPRSVVPVNSEVFTMSDADIKSFHCGREDKLVLHYYSQVITHGRQFAPQLLLAVLDKLEELFSETSLAEIRLLRRTLTWQQVFQNKSL
ncbi:MAG: hypothetical protein AB1757_28130 [Acidobacteriota bacterium]